MAASPAPLLPLGFVSTTWGGGRGWGAPICASRVLTATVLSPKRLRSQPSSATQGNERARSLRSSFAPELEPRSRVAGPRVVVSCFFKY